MRFILDDNLKFEDYVHMIETEKACFDPMYWSSPEHEWEHYCHNRETFICVRDLETGNIVAHACMIPISDELSQQIINGSVIDSQISVDDILKYDQPCACKLHISVIAISDEYRDKSILLLIFKAFRKKVVELAKRGIIFTGVSADCVTQAGAMLCEKLLNMKFIKHTPHGSKIYWGDGLFNIHVALKEAVAK